MKGWVHWNPFTVQRFPLPAGFESSTARSADHHLTHRATRAPVFRRSITKFSVILMNLVLAYFSNQFRPKDTGT